jgi:hypothetical protein
MMDQQKPRTSRITDQRTKKRRGTLGLNNKNAATSRTEDEEKGGSGGGGGEER